MYPNAEARIKNGGRDDVNHACRATKHGKKHEWQTSRNPPSHPSSDHAPSWKTNKPNEPSTRIGADIKALENLDEREYTNLIQGLYKSLVKGNVLNYHEARTQLPNALKESRSTKIIEKIISLKPQFQRNYWTAVTADVTERCLTMTSFSKACFDLLENLKELDVGRGKKVVVPVPQKPHKNTTMLIFWCLESGSLIQNYWAQLGASFPRPLRSRIKT